ncbi:MAG: hypothetical protein PHI91_03485 [Candidatus Pacebacteria bacterium]|nr:hypothetical protein [Candidatus Paceibacterota bacterium]
MSPTLETADDYEVLSYLNDIDAFNSYFDDDYDGNNIDAVNDFRNFSQSELKDFYGCLNCNTPSYEQYVCVIIGEDYQTMEFYIEDEISKLNQKLNIFNVIFGYYPNAGLRLDITSNKYALDTEYGYEVGCNIIAFDFGIEILNVPKFIQNEIDIINNWLKTVAIPMGWKKYYI